MLTALAGGVGAARFLRGLVAVVPPETVTVIVNTGDDDEFHGLYVSPDLDSVTYTLAGADNPDTGWGLADETFATIEALERYGRETWFRLGDRDLALLAVAGSYQSPRNQSAMSASCCASSISRSPKAGMRSFRRP